MDFLSCGSRLCFSLCVTVRMFQLIGDLCHAVTMKVTTIHEVYWIINFACDLKKLG